MQYIFPTLYVTAAHCIGKQNQNQMMIFVPIFITM